MGDHELRLRGGIFGAYKMKIFVLWDKLLFFYPLLDVLLNEILIGRIKVGCPGCNGDTMEYVEQDE